MRSDCEKAATRSQNSLTIGRWTNTRVPAKQICPELENTPMAAPGTALSRSASANTMSGDLPPSSSCSLLIFTADASMILRPVVVDPVKAILSTSGCLASAAPATGPSPVTTLMTPGGKPSSCNSSTTRRTLSEASSAGLMTVVHPVASTAPRIHHWLISGPFQGMIPPTTPTGARTLIVRTSPGRLFCRVSPAIFAV